LAAPTLALLGCGPAAAPTKPKVPAEDVIAAVETAQNTVQDTALYLDSSTTADPNPRMR
jgi:hypothetical protein